MKRAVLFFNGNSPSKNLVFKTIKTTDTIICADGGAKHALETGITPHVILGDLDSLPQLLQKRLRKLPIEWITFSIEKDFTDSELALEFAIKKGFREIVLLGVFGDRYDHVLSNIMLLARLAKKSKGVSLWIVEEKQTLYFIEKKMTLSGKKGQTISLLSVDGDAKGVSTTGLQWKLHKELLPFGVSRGVSNLFTGTKATVSLEKGVLLVVLTG